MINKTKICLIIGAFLVIIGLLIFVGVMTVAKWDFSKLSTIKYETNVHEVQGDFSDILLNTETADVIFVLSDDSKCRIECYEEENAKHSVNLNDRVLKIETADNRKWYQNIEINVGLPKITVYLPSAKYGVLTVKGSTGNVEIPKEFAFDGIDIHVSTGDIKLLARSFGHLKVRTTTGRITLEDTTARDIDLSVSTGGVMLSGISCEGDINIIVSTGKTELTQVNCQSLISRGSTGSLSLNGVIAEERLSLERSTGKIKLERCDAKEIYIKTSTGDVTGTLLSEKIFVTKTDTGRVMVPSFEKGGRCEIKTDTGDIKIEIIE